LALGVGNMNQVLAVSLEQKCPVEQLLLRELSHRVTNELASAISVISLAAARCSSEEARTALAAVQDRLHSYASVQNSLQMPEYDICIDATAYLRRLCRAISHSKLDSRGIELLLADYPFSMSSERCRLLGMIVSELITNAARHAFRCGGGSICVELLPSGTFVECRVTDNGTSDTNICPGQGSKIINALTDSLHGTIDQQFGPQGAKSVLIFPLHP
jgi:two-component sensor histidine kinase